MHDEPMPTDPEDALSRQLRQVHLPNDWRSTLKQIPDLPTIDEVSANRNEPAQHAEVQPLARPAFPLPRWVIGALAASILLTSLLIHRYSAPEPHPQNAYVPETGRAEIIQPKVVATSPQVVEFNDTQEALNELLALQQQLRQERQVKLWSQELSEKRAIRSWTGSSSVQQTVVLQQAIRSGKEMGSHPRDLNVLESWLTQSQAPAP